MLTLFFLPRVLSSTPRTVSFFSRSTRLAHRQSLADHCLLNLLPETVIDYYNTWIAQLVSDYSVDGLRIEFVLTPSSFLPSLLPPLSELNLTSKSSFYLHSFSAPPSTSERTSGLASPSPRESSPWERSSTEEFPTTLLIRR